MDVLVVLVFFFQAEDGIRDWSVTGVQTCALPIYLTLKFMDKSKAANKPFFVWLNPTRMHIVTHLSPKYEALRNSKNGWTIEEAGLAQLDDIVCSVMQYLKDNGFDDNTIVVFTTDNGTETFTWPDGGSTPFRGEKGTVFEGGFRVPCILRWPGHVPANSV